MTWKVVITEHLAKGPSLLTFLITILSLNFEDAAAEIAADNQSIAQKTEEKAAAETEKNEVESSLEGTEKAIADLEKYATEVHSACDFVLKNFDLRQTARGDEISALEDAKAILSGADFGF